MEGGENDGWRGGSHAVLSLLISPKGLRQAAGVVEEWSPTREERS